jgi:ABC-type sugar transport system substrate-binding protein
MLRSLPQLPTSRSISQQACAAAPENKGVFQVKKSRILHISSALAATSLVMVALAGCSSNTPSSSASASGGKSLKGTVIGISFPYVNNSFYQTEISLLQADAKKAGLVPLPVTDAGSDTSKQLSDIQTLISRGAKGLVVQAQDSNALAAAASSAHSKGIPMTSPNVGINSPFVVNVHPDNTAMATIACNAVGKALGGKGNVYFEGGDLSGAAGLDRWNGFHDCLSKNFPKMTVTMKESKWDATVATNQLQTTLTANPNIQAIVMASDSVYATGTVATLKQLGLLKPAGQSGHIYVTGIDGSPEGLAGIRSKSIDSIVSEPLPLEDQLSIDYLVGGLQGKKYHAGKTTHNSTIVSVKGVLTDIVPAVLVTSKNVDDKSLWGNNK